jgi:hypothetical protein
MAQATFPAYKRGHRRGYTAVDVAAFRHQIDQAMQAFESDVSYAVLMARAAVTIVKKREVWQARRDARGRA